MAAGNVLLQMTGGTACPTFVSFVCFFNLVTFISFITLIVFGRLA
jgi:hypothetical protein